MNDWKQKLRMRLPALVLLAATLLFWGLYDRYELDGPVLLESPSLTNATRVRGDCTETNGHFTLNVARGGKPANIHFRLPDGAAYGMIRVRGRAKVDGVVVGKNPWRCARLLLIQYDQHNKWIPGHHGVIAEEGTTDWIPHEDIFEIDGKAVEVDLVIQQTGSEGKAEFDRLVVEAIRLRASYIRWQFLFAGLWIAMGFLYYHRCRLDRRRLRLLILLNAIAIIVGVMMPEKWIEDTTDYTKEGVEKVVAAAKPKPHSGKPVQPPAKKSTEESKIEEFSGWVGGVHGAGHFTLFASLCFLVYLSAALEQQHRSYFYKVAFDILLFAAATESLQYLTLDRTPGIHDWLVDFGGMAAAFLLFLLVRVFFLSRSSRIESNSF